MKLKLSPVLLVFLLDLLLLALVSSIIAGGFYFIGISFKSVFLITFGLISILGIISNKIIEKRSSLIINKLQLEKERLASNQTITLNCSYCQVPNNIRLNVNGDMSFDCLNCKQSNRILLSYGAARITTPLNVSMPIEPRLQDKED